MKNQQIVFPRPKEVSVIEKEIPNLQDNDILVQTRKTLISTGTELTGFSGDYPPNSYWSTFVKYPWAPGYSNVGEILETGRMVQGYKKGDILFSNAPHAKYWVLNETNYIINKIPDGLNDEDAVFATIAQIVLNCVRQAQIQLGESVIVVGLGLLGQFAVQLSKLNGALDILGVDLSQHRTDIASKGGATHTFRGPIRDLVESLGNIFPRKKAEVVFEVTGDPVVLPEALKLLNRIGRFMVLGSPRGESKVDFHDLVQVPGIRIFGAHNSTHPEFETCLNPWTCRNDNELFFRLLEKKLVVTDILRSHSLRWDEADKAYGDMLRDRTQYMGVVLNWR